MFLKPDGSPVTPDYLTRRLVQLVKLHELPPIRFHDLQNQAKPRDTTEAASRRSTSTHDK